MRWVKGLRLLDSICGQLPSSKLSFEVYPREGPIDINDVYFVGQKSYGDVEGFSSARLSACSIFAMSSMFASASSPEFCPTISSERTGFE